MTRVIGFAGPAGAGKDTCAEILMRRYGFRRLAFADELYRQVAEAYEVPIEFLQARPTKETPTARLALKRCWNKEAVSFFIDAFDVYDRDALDVFLCAPRSPRKVVQWFGTLYRRAQDADYWVGIVERQYEDLVKAGVPGIVLSDVRFDNEVAFVRARGRLAHVENPRIWARDDFISERPVARQACDAVIVNDGSFAELEAAVLKI